MLLVKKTLNLLTGQQIPPGLLLTYRIKFLEPGNKFQVTFVPFFNLEAYQTGKLPIPYGHLDIFQLPQNGIPTNVAQIEISEDAIPEQLTNWSKLTDTLAMIALDQIAQNLTAADIEMIGFGMGEGLVENPNI